MPFPHGGHRVDHLAIHQTEIAGVELDVEFGEAADQAVEDARRPQFETCFAVTFATDRMYDVSAGSPFADEIGHHLGGILKVGIDHHDGIARCPVHTGGYCRLMAEVPRQREHHHIAARRMKLTENLRRLIARSVVDVHDFRSSTVRREDGCHPAVKLPKAPLFVEHGDDDGNLHAIVCRRGHGRRGARHRGNSTVGPAR